MHLSGQADAGNLVAAQIALRQRRRHGHTARAPPVSRVLLRPADLRRGKGLMLFGGRGNYTAALVNDESARTSGTHIDP